MDNLYTDDLIRACYKWDNNSHLIMDVARLGYLRRNMKVLDPTYGKGNWWKYWKPEHLDTFDDLSGVDFRDLPAESNSYDAIAFDPAYVSMGGRDTSKIPDFTSRYGLIDAPSTPQGLQDLINEGVTEMERVLKESGILLVKCKDYVSGGNLWLGTHHTLTHALSLNLKCIDRLEMIQGPTPQPVRERQCHARRNLSTLLIFRKRPSSYYATLDRRSQHLALA